MRQQQPSQSQVRHICCNGVQLFAYVHGMPLCNACLPAYTSLLARPSSCCLFWQLDVTGTFHIHKSTTTHSRFPDIWAVCLWHRCCCCWCCRA
jgi:hypothetical protein